MWKREEDPKPAPATAQPTPVATAPMSSAGAGPRDRAVLGSSLALKGEISGAEDLQVQGRVEGRIELPDHTVTIGSSGKIAADVFAKAIVVEGEVRGNLFAGEQILIRKAGNVHGNLTAPRVVLEDGCRFKGSVEMESAAAGRKPQPAPRPEPETRPAASATSAPTAAAATTSAGAASVPSAPAGATAATAAKT